MKLVDATLNIDPTILAFEITGRGAPNRKLESLALLNGFKGHDAHDALGDVRATIFIANQTLRYLENGDPNFVNDRGYSLLEIALQCSKTSERNYYVERLLKAKADPNKVSLTLVNFYF